MKILCTSSLIGLGHATRDVAIASELKKERKAEILFVSGYPATRLIKNYGFNSLDLYSPPKFKIKNGELKNVSLWFVKYLLYYRKCKGAIRSVLEKEKPDFLISDEDFAGITIAKEKGIPSVFVTDILRMDFARNPISAMIERVINKWISKFLKRCEMVIVPDYGEEQGNIRYVGPITREVEKDRETLRQEMSFCEKIILVTAGGTVGGEFLIRDTLRTFLELDRKDIRLIVVGGPNLRIKELDGKRIEVYDYIRDLHEVIFASDLVISLAGKSTLDEIRVSGTPFIIIPIKNHFEQERNAKKLGYSFEDRKRLKKMILNKLQGRREKPIGIGIEKAVDIIIEFFRKHCSG